MNKIVLAIIFISAATLASAQHRRIAITIDDLPVVSTREDIATRQEITRKIVGHIQTAKVPVIGFVNEDQLYDDDTLDKEEVDLLRVWLDAGLELGNHTFSHMSLNGNTVADYEADILKGEKVTKELLAAKGREMRYFRHPYLETGKTLAIKAELDAFFKEHGYRIAPITYDTGDYIFTRAYDNAFDAHDEKLMKRIGAAYVPYMERKLRYWERQSRRLFGREIAQTLLIHANFINSDYLGDLIAMFKRRGYKCVDLDTALKDKAYRLPDRYVGGAGISWLSRWALARGKKYVLDGEPTVPKFVLKASGFPEDEET